MTVKSYLVATMLLALLPLAAASAQTTRTSQTAAKGGVQHKGRHSGYVPAHERSRQSAAKPKRQAPDQGEQYEEQYEEVVVSHNEPARTKARPASHRSPPIITEGPEFIGSPLIDNIIPSDQWLCDGPAGGCLPTFYASAEYLLWWTRGQSTPALATTSTTGTARAEAGVLGLPNTSILFGNERLNDDDRSGGRFTLGGWINDDNSLAIEFTYMFLGEDTQSFSASQQTASILARPFFNTVTGEQDARQIVFPGALQGSLAIEASNDFQSMELAMRRPTHDIGCRQVDFLIGYRVAQLDDSIIINESSLALSGATAGTTLSVLDLFRTRSTFQGPEIGLTMMWPVTGCWSATFSSKIAIGITEGQATVNGLTSSTVNNVTSTSQFGLLTQNSNIGHYSENNFSSLGDLQFILRRQITPGMALTCGYNFLYWSDVLRAGDQIDARLNPSQIPPSTLSGAPLPEFATATSGYWAHGVNFGLEWNY